MVENRRFRTVTLYLRNLLLHVLCSSISLAVSLLHSVYNYAISIKMKHINIAGSISFVYQLLTGLFDCMEQSYWLVGAEPVVPLQWMELVPCVTVHSVLPLVMLPADRWGTKEHVLWRMGHCKWLLVRSLACVEMKGIVSGLRLLQLVTTCVSTCAELKCTSIFCSWVEYVVYVRTVLLYV